jgi:hypothetical protein
VEQDGSAPSVLPVADRFAHRELTLARPDTACWATMPGTGMLEGYGAPARPRKARRVSGAIEVVTRLGRQSLLVKALDEVRVRRPTARAAWPRPSRATACARARHGRAVAGR